MKRKRMTKRIVAIILAAVMMIPTHVTSFAADASAQNTAGQEAGNATSGDSQTTQSENQAATQNDSSTTGTDTNAGSTGMLSSAVVSCAGSTGGGLKMLRVAIIFSQLRHEFTRLLYPNAVTPVTIDAAEIPNTISPGSVGS